MKNFKKTISLVMVIGMLVGLLSGCTATVEGKALYDAMVKSQSIKSSQNDMQFTFKIDATGLNEEEQISFAQIQAMANDAKMSMNMKQTANDDNTAAKAAVDMNMSMGGMSMDMGVWVDMDLKSTEPKFIEIIKLPAMVTAMDPKMAGKEYMVMDIAEMMDSSELSGPASDVNYSDIMKLSKELQEKANAFLAGYMAQYDPGFKLITKVGAKNIVTPAGTVKANVYQIKLDDKAVKKLVRYTVNNFANSKDAMDFTTEYIKFIQKFTESTTASASATAEFENAMKDFETAKPELLAEFNSFMDKIEGIKLIGDNGIVLEYAIDENGYIVSQSGSMNFVIDMAKLAALENGMANGSGIYNATVDFGMLTYNINKAMTIDFPVLTPANSIDYNQMMKATVPTKPAPAADVKPLTAMPTASKVMVNGKVVSFDAYTIEGSNYFKLRDLAKIVNGTQKQFDVTYDSEKKTINLLSNKAYTVVGGEMAQGDGKDKTAVLNTGTILKDGVPVPFSAYTINGNNYFKLRDLGQAFNIGVTWDGTAQTIAIDTAADYVAQ